MNTSFFILDLVLKSTVVLLLALALQQFQTRSSAARRGFAWLVTFVVLALLPVGLLSTPKVVLNWLPHRELPAPTVSLPPIYTREVKALPASVVQSKLDETARRSFTTTEALLTIWMLGALLVLAQRATGEVSLRKLRRRSQLVRDQNITRCVSGVARKFGIRRAIEVSQSDALQVPVTWGTLRPALLLPAGASEWSAAQRDAALRHELGHIRHFDSAKRLLAQFVCAAHWFNPLVWLAARSWRTVQEQACDDLVLSSGADAESYAMQLLHVAQSLGSDHAVPAAALAMAKPSTLETRLTSIMDDSRDRHPVSRMMRIAGTALGLITLGFGTIMQLRGEDKPAEAKIESTDNATILIESRIIEAPAGTMRVIKSDPASGPGVRVIMVEEPDGTIVRQLSATKGADVLSAPRLTTRSGQKATVQIGRDVVLDPGDPKKTEFVGTSVSLLPTLHGKEMDLEIKVSISEQTGGRGERPIIQSHKMESRVTVHPGSTVIMLQDAGPKNGVRKEIFFLVTPKVIGEENHPEAKPVTNDLEPQPASPKKKEQALTTKAYRIQPGQLVSLSAPNSSIKNVLMKRGVTFPEGASVAYVASSGQLIVKDTEANQRLVEEFLQEISAAKQSEAKSELQQRAETIIFPTIHFQGATLEETVEFLRNKGRELDSQKQGVNIIVLHSGDSRNATIGLDLRDVPLSEVLKYVAGLSGLEIEAQENAIVLKPAAAAPDKAAAPARAAAALEHAKKIVLPGIEFRDATVTECIDYLRVRSLELDPEKRGVNIILKPEKDAKQATLTLSLKNIPLAEALRYVAGLAGLEIEADDHAIVLTPRPVK